MAEAATDQDTLRYLPRSYITPLPLEEMFPAVQPIEVELGAGDGSFLAAHASEHRDRNFIGVERLLGRLRKIDKKARRAGLQNLRLIRIEAGYFARYLLPPGSIVACHIYFPDPWPKRRHWKNRLITEEFVEILGKALKPGGTVHLRTDNRDYFDQMLRSFSPSERFEKFETPEPLMSEVTDFEREFHKRGIPTLHASYRRGLG